jgi:type IV pilus assembly protein PilX
MFIVLVIMLLALILVLGGLSVTSLNESLVGNQSDAQRAYGSAQALIDAAQRDIRLNGRFCGAAIMGGNGTNPTFAGGPACTLRFPRNKGDYGQMDTTAAPGLGNCVNGVCISQGPADPKFATGTIGNGDPDVNAEQIATGAIYTLVGAALDGGGAAGIDYGANAAAGATATALGNNSVYWVEVFTYNINSMAIGGIGNMPVPDPAYPFVFRITAMAQGLRGNTQSVLRTYYTPYPI